MARKKSSSKKKYGSAASKSVKSAMHRKKRGKLKSGKGGKGSCFGQYICGADFSND